MLVLYGPGRKRGGKAKAFSFAQPSPSPSLCIFAQLRLAVTDGSQQVYLPHPQIIGGGGCSSALRIRETGVHAPSVDPCQVDVDGFLPRFHLFVPFSSTNVASRAFLLARFLSYTVLSGTSIYGHHPLHDIDLD